MAQTKIIVDTNSYLRLAQNIHPLLGVPFGKKENTLYMHSELNAEFRASSRLQSKFQWACEPDFVDNRRRPLSLSKQQKVDENYIDLPMIERIVEQWQYENDTPNAKWKEEYRRLFEHDPPTD